MIGQYKALAPEPYFTAYNYLVHMVFLRLRNNGGRISPEELSDLGYALHNVPQFLVESGTWDDATFRKRYLEPYDKKWSVGRREPSLVQLLEEGLALARDRDK